MDDVEKMDDDKEETENEEIGTEEHEEEHQTARAISLQTRRGKQQLDSHSILKLVYPLHEKDRTEEHTQEETQ